MDELAHDFMIFFNESTVLFTYEFMNSRFHDHEFISCIS